MHSLPGRFWRATLLLAVSAIACPGPAAALPNGVPGVTCTAAQLSTPGALACGRRTEQDVINHVAAGYEHLVVCLPSGHTACCQKQQGSNSYSCSWINITASGGGGDAAPHYGVLNGDPADPQGAASGAGGAMQ
jgi:hypothetical protein